jgi:hypothetical protein
MDGSVALQMSSETFFSPSGFLVVVERKGSIMKWTENSQIKKRTLLHKKKKKKKKRS